MRHSRPLLCLVAIFAFIGMAPAPATAQRTERMLEIPSRPLAQALSDFASQTGLQMLYDAPLAAGRQSSAVSGMMSPRSGLALLLQGTGLSARFTSAGAVVIYASTASTVTLNPLTAVAAPVIGRDRSDPVFVAYADAVRRRIVDHVRTKDELTDVGYRVSIRVWVSADGTPNRAEILSSSGDPERDDRFLERVMTTALPVAPAYLPQPLRIEFSVRPRG